MAQRETPLVLRVQDHLRRLADQGIDLRPRAVLLHDTPHFATSRTLRIDDTHSDDPKVTAFFTTESENNSRVRVEQRQAIRSNVMHEMPATFASQSVPLIYNPQVTPKGGDPIIGIEEDLRHDVGHHLFDALGIDKRDDDLKLHPYSASIYRQDTDKTNNRTYLLEHDNEMRSERFSNINEAISHMLSLPALGVNLTSTNGSLMTGEEHALTSRILASTHKNPWDWRSTILHRPSDGLTLHQPDITDTMSTGLPKPLPPGYIHVVQGARKMGKFTSYPSWTTPVQHYAYNPDTEELKHIMTSPEVP